MAYLQATCAEDILGEIEDEDERQGAAIVTRSLSAPVKQIAKNAGVEGEVVLAKIQSHYPEEPTYGWNARNAEYGDMLEMGVVDAAKITMNALENSASIAGLVLTTECLVTEIPVETTEEQRQQQFDEGYQM